MVTLEWGDSRVGGGGWFPVRSQTLPVTVIVSSLIDEDCRRRVLVQIDPVCPAVAVDVNEVDTLDTLLFMLSIKGRLANNLR
jgi:hypothetical protein